MNKTLDFQWFFYFVLNFLLLKAYEITQCSRQIHEECPNTYVTTTLEVERARIFIQDKFMKESAYPPTVPPCASLYVRRNFKCITHEERLRVINVVQKLYANGLMWELAEVHNKCYVPWHKSMEGATAHRWLSTKLELAMREIDPDISIPYWIPSEDCSSPHKSLIWRYFGTSGNETNDWCVKDCPFSEQTEGHCIKRQWNPDGTIPPWYCPLLERIGPGMIHNLPVLLFASLGQHFHYHFNIGGANGHFSHNWASYDFIFYMLHVYYTDDLMAKWQLSEPALLTPESYNILARFNFTTHERVRANISSDTICHFNSSILESWQFGFGQQCWVSDRLVQAINQELDNVSTGAVEMLIERTPAILRPFLSPIVSKWSPLKAHGLEFPDPSICNPNCEPQPFAPTYISDETRRNAMKAFRDDWNSNTYLGMILSEFNLRSTVNFLNKSWFCSPYVSSNNGSGVDYTSAR